MEAGGAGLGRGLGGGRGLTRTRRFVVASVAALALAGAVLAALGPPVRVLSVETDAMAPALPRGARVEVRVWPRRPYRPRRGDLVALAAPDRPGTWYVKRVVGLPGERIEVVAGRVLLQSRNLEEPWRDLARGGGPDVMPPVKIPTGHVYLLGDVRGLAHDSRRFGAVARGDLLGPVERIE